jgi:hypothetical protein
VRGVQPIYPEKIAMSRKAIGFAAVLLAAGMISGCNQNQQKNAGQPNAQQEFTHGGHGGLRKVCADDIQKYCANEQRPRRCLRDNMDKLSDACKTFLQEHRGGRNHDNNGNNNNDNNNNDND